MGYMKTTYDYFDLNAPFTPLPRYGHLSKNSPEYKQVEPSIRKTYEVLFSLPDFPSVRAVAGDADAVMPPGGPDRYKSVVTELIDIPTRDGIMIELKLYKSPDAKNNAVLMYRMHGGGWCLGRHEVDGVDNVYAATNTGIIVIYGRVANGSRAPEHPFPTPINDCYDGLIWCKKNADKLGVDPEKIIISGGSAGGQLVNPPLYFTYGQQSDNLAGSFARSRLRQRRHSPLLSESFKGLPPTLIQCGGTDVLRDDSFAYADALKKDGVDVELHCYAGLPHWFPVVLPQTSQSVHFYERYNNFLARYAGK
ncbi:AB hydrolase superfamily [Fusarium subglutinans]|uniref:AB hydrolase superfamily n=1 Tax=Gibberella subglutinans TaxID=42677 RepID=A0A8H5Q585_GIBSU|nr:AB hydrolase superfamily [Fusarium subglutinans]KAF5608489.1 AB hydrolase superfamily [Fusarium subglutinans]